MRILTYHAELRPVAAELWGLDVARELTRRGHQVDLLYARDGGISDEFREVCASMRKVPLLTYSENPLSDAPRLIAAAWKHRHPRPDVISANDFNELGWAGAERAFTRAPIVCYLHRHVPIRGLSMRALSPLASRFLVATDSQRLAWVTQGLDPAHIGLVPQAIKLDAFPPGSASGRARAREALGLPLDAYVVLYLGRVAPEKGVDVLIDAWRSVSLPMDQARLVIVGGTWFDGSEDDYAATLHGQLPEGVDWLPMRRDVITPLHAADVLVLPAVWEEPFGRVLIEAMATGLPVIASRVGGIPEILDGEFERFLVPKGDVVALAERLLTLRDWRTHSPELAQACVDRVAERYSLEATVSRFESVLISAASR